MRDQDPEQCPFVRRGPRFRSDYSFSRWHHLGDVFADDFGYHGEGINIAARLQAECPAGGVCISRAVHYHIEAKLDISFANIGPLKLKNIAKTIDSYVLDLTPDTITESTAVVSTRTKLTQPTPSEKLQRGALWVSMFTSLG